ncbi:MAG: Wzz/FepE/Etk N-terminal domain-containing protein [Thermodesulfobacteriota bacterium]
MLQKKDIKEEEIHLKDYVNVMLRRVWIVIISLIISVKNVSIFSIKVTPIYQAKTLVMIERDNPNVVSFEDVSLNYSEPCVSLNMTESDFE